MLRFGRQQAFISVEGRCYRNLGSVSNRSHLWPTHSGVARRPKSTTKLRKTACRPEIKNMSVNFFRRRSVGFTQMLYKPRLPRHSSFHAFPLLMTRYTYCGIPHISNLDRPQWPGIDWTWWQICEFMALWGDDVVRMLRWCWPLRRPQDAALLQKILMVRHGLDRRERVRAIPELTQSDYRVLLTPDPISHNHIVSYHIFV